MEQKARPAALKVVFICFIISFLISVLYLGGGELLAWNGLYYRTWLVIIGELFVFVLTPILFLLIPALAIGQAAKRRRTGGMHTAAVGIWIVLGLIGFAYFAAGTLIYAFLRADSIEREVELEDGIIESVHTENYGMETYPVYRYYEPYTVFLKRTYEPMSVIVEKKAEERYGVKFAVSAQDKEREQQEKLRVYTLSPDSEPELVMHMYAGDTVYGFSCDYPQARANWLLGQNEAFTAIAEIPQASGGAENDAADAEESGEEAALVEAPVILVCGEEDGRTKAQTIAAAMQKVREDSFFAGYEERDACLYLELYYEEEYMGRLPLYFDVQETVWSEAGNTAQETEETSGNTPQQTKQLAAYITEQIMQQYREHTAALSESGEAGGNEKQPAGNEGGQNTGQPQETDAAAPQTDGERQDNAGTEAPPQESDNLTPKTVEGAYLCLYEQLFKEQDAAYDCRYNAKGNFYAFLSEGRDVPKSGTEELRAEYTVVYDRESKNGECHLFVYYETFYNEDGTEYGTTILDIYAVNKETGEVTASGKRAWEDVGSAQYQEAAGEK